MPVLRCTQKLLKERGVAPSEAIAPVGTLGAWHSNLLRFDRQKCVLFTNDSTLYSMFVRGLRKPQFQRIKDVFGQSLFHSLRLGGFAQPQIETVLENIDGFEELQT